MSGVRVVLVAGSRGYAQRAIVERAVEQIETGALVISGGARGVDTWAIAHAQHCGFVTHVYPADWKHFGKGAGMLRNRALVEQCHEALIFHDGASKGTQHTIALLDAARKPYLLFNRDGDLVLIVGTDGYRSVVTRQGGRCP